MLPLPVVSRLAGAAFDRAAPAFYCMAAKRKQDTEKRPVGRPRSTMTPENVEAILRTVRLGMYPDRAAQMHGVNASSLRSFRDTNEEFRTALEKAESDAENSFLGRMIRHTETQWTAVAWMLERRWPERWAKREFVISQDDVPTDDKFA